LTINAQNLKLFAVFKSESDVKTAVSRKIPTETEPSFWY